MVLNKYGSRNSTAANDWAAKKKAQMERAKQLREERKKETLTEEHTFEPQTSGRKVATGSSGYDNISAYSQQYLKDFHYNSNGSLISDGGRQHMTSAGQAIVSQNYDDTNFQQDSGDHPGHDSLSAAFQQHGNDEASYMQQYQQQQQQSDYDPCEMTYEFAASNSPRHETEESYNNTVNTKSKLSLLRRKSSSASSRGKAASSFKPKSSNLAPSTKNSNQENNQACTRQSGCKCAQCGSYSAVSDVKPITYQECTRQSGCTCSQCDSSTTFQSMLRSDSASSRNDRPSWNNDFTEPTMQVEQQNSFPQTKPVRAKPKQKRRPQQQRPQWSDDFAEPAAVSAAAEEMYSARSSTSTRDDEMRAAMGKKDDFIAQVHQQGSKRSTRQPSDSNNTPRRQSKYRQEAPSASDADSSRVNVAHRGIFRPEESPTDSQSTTQRQSQAQVQAQARSSPRQPVDELPVGSSSGLPEGLSEYAAPVSLQQCNSCGRKFGETAYSKHVKVCKKVFQTKRKAFNSTEARLAGVAQTFEDQDLVKKIVKEQSKPGAKAKAAAAKKTKSAKWKKQSSALRQAMMYNKKMNQVKASGGNIADMPPPPAQEEDSDMLKCPHCGRTFNQNAGERHIPKCKDQSKPKRLIRGTGGASSSLKSKGKKFGR